MSGWTGTLRKGMLERGFFEAGGWTWSHPMLKTIRIHPNSLPEKPSDVFSHRLREAWRIMNYDRFLELDRRDSAACGAILCDLARLTFCVRESSAAMNLQLEQMHSSLLSVVILFDGEYRRDLPVLSA